MAIPFLQNLKKEDSRLPSAARNFKRLQVVTVWLPSFINLCFNTFQ